MSRAKIVGFDRKLELAWLDAAAGQVAQGASADGVRKYLWNLLEGSVSGGGQSWNSDRGKTITVLAHIWSEVPDEAADLRDRALTAFPDASPQERVSIHWAMCLATYPFFGDVADTVGKLLSLQDTVAIAEIRNRMIEKWGDRVITKNASQRIVRGFVAWGTLNDSDKRGVYEAPASRNTIDATLAELLVEALLLWSQSGTLPANQVLSHRALFPFQLDSSPALLRRSERFEVDRYGLDVEMVRFEEVKMNLDSERDAAVVFDRVLPAGQPRQILLSMFAEAIREANQQGRHCWAVRYTSDRVRLYVQHLIVFTLINGEGWLALDSELIGQEETELLSTSSCWRWPPLDEDYRCYKEVPTQNGYYSPSETHQTFWPLVRRLHFSLIYRAACETTMDPRTREGHSSGVLMYLRNTLGEHVPDPLY